MIGYSCGKQHANYWSFVPRAIDKPENQQYSNGVFSTTVLPQPDALTPSVGTDTIFADGTFNSSFTVNADLIL